jgi:predicted aspartyl protease
MMPPKTIAFDDSELSAGGIPRAAVTLLGPGGPKGSRANFAGVLIDTGATHTQLPEDVARNIGIDPSQGAAVQIATSNGTANRQHLTVTLEIQGVTVTGIDVYFGGEVAPLLGRSSLYAAFAAAGFEPAEWLRKL